MSLQTLFESQDSWSQTCTHDAEALSDATIKGKLALLLSEVGSGEIRVPEGGLYHVLDPEGIAYWSREVLEKLQAVCQPAGLHTFFIDEGGGTYGFVCSNGVYAMHHRRGFLGRYEDIASFFAKVFADIASGEEPFSTDGDSDAIEKLLRQAKMCEPSRFEEHLAGKTHADFRPYDPYIPWSEGDLMMHPKEGRGVVVAVKTTMYIQVEFASGKKTLGHKGW